MPIYMDLHIVPGVNPKEVAEAHSRDVYLEKDHNCKCLTYWVDELRGHVFCLIEAPSRETVYELHNRSHGLLPHKIIEVQPGLVQAFLGRITDPESGQFTDAGHLVVDDTSYRMIMSVQLPDPVLVQQRAGTAAAAQLLQAQNQLIRNEITAHDGREALQETDRIIGSFITAEKAVAAAHAIQKKLVGTTTDQYHISIHAGDPVAQHDKLFGETLQLLQRMSFLHHTAQISITAGVKELIVKELLHKTQKNLFVLSADDEKLLNALFDILEEKYTDTVLQVNDYARSLAMSESQFYRKTTALTGYSPNELVKEFRLAKAKELLQKGSGTITEISYSCGFSTPSYFTKCFRKKFGLVPLDYLQSA